MGRSIKSKPFPIAKSADRSRGYILITLMLFMSLLAMAALAVLPNTVQQIQRDREEEMIHRGTEYMRAIKKYYKKFGRYPSRIEELENTNQQRFLRKRFKDPIARGTTQEFKLVRMGDPALATLGMGAGIGQGPGGQGPGLGQGPGQGPGSGQPAGLAKGLFVAMAGGGVRPAGPEDANAPQVTGLPGQQNSGTQNPTGADGNNPETQVDPKSASSDSEPASGGQVFGGGPILGVASSSKERTIREFNKKNHYNDWLFVYDVRADRGGLLKGPLLTGTTMDMGGSTGKPGAPPVAPGQSGTTPTPAGPPGQQEPPEE